MTPPLQLSPLTPLEAFLRADEWERAALLVAVLLVPGVAGWFAADGRAVPLPVAPSHAGPAPTRVRASTARLVRPPRSC